MNLICFISFLLVTISSGQTSSSEQFCQMDDPIVSRAFIIRNHIYFGDEQHFWTLNIENFNISNENQSIKQIFGRELNMNRVMTAIHFGDIFCNHKECENVNKALNLVLIVGTIKSGDKDIRYKAYRVDQNMEFVAEMTNDSMPWDIPIHSILQNCKLFDVPGISATTEGITFDEMSQTIFFSTDSNPIRALIYYRKLNETFGVFNDFEVIDTNNVYSGLIDWEGVIYGLSNNTFYLLGSNNDLKEREQFSVKQFFNCDGNTPLNQTKQNSIPTDTIQTIESTTESTTMSTESSSDDETTYMVTTTGTDITSTIGSKSNLFLWIFIILIISIVFAVLIVVIILVIIFLGKHKEDDNSRKLENNKNDSKSKVDSDIVSEITSKVPSQYNKSPGLKSSKSKSKSPHSKIPKSKVSSSKPKSSQRQGKEVSKSSETQLVRSDSKLDSIKSVRSEL